jgi:hypothetical protein
MAGLKMLCQDYFDRMGMDRWLGKLRGDAAAPVTSGPANETVHPNLGLLAFFSAIRILSLSSMVRDRLVSISARLDMSCAASFPGISA